jgi:hypothetical protein
VTSTSNDKILKSPQPVKLFWRRAA